MYGRLVACRFLLIGLVLLKLNDSLLQALSIDQPHGEVVHAAFAANSIHGHNVRMFECTRSDGFILETLQLL